MRSIYTLFTFLASIIVIVTGAVWIVEWQKFGHLFPNIDKTMQSETKPATTPVRVRGIPSKNSLAISTDLEALVSEGWRGSDGKPLYLPVYAGTDFGKMNFFWSSGGTIDTRWRMGGGCNRFGSSLAVNFVRWDTVLGEATTYFQRRVLLANYGVYQSPKHEYLVALVVRADGNSDGFYGCDDEASFEIFSMKTGEHRVIDQSFIPNEIAWHGLSSDLESFSFTKIDNLDGRNNISLYNLNFQTGNIAKVEKPDILSDAAMAIENLDIPE